MRLFTMPFLTAIMILQFCYGLQAQSTSNTYLIKGTIRTTEQRDSIGKVILAYSIGDEYIVDTAMVKNGTFHFNGKVPGVIQANLRVINKYLSKQENIDREFKHNRSLYIGEGSLAVEVTGGIKDASISGSRRTTDWDAYQKYVAPALENNENVYQQTRHLSKEERAPKRIAALKAIDDAKRSFIAENGGNSFALESMKDLLQEYQNEHLFSEKSSSMYQELLGYFKALSPELQNTPEGKSIAARLSELSTRQLPQFSGPSLAGGTLDISEYKGRVFLIDFWGSWCVWCRKGHPHLKELYAKYKPKGFEIIGIGVELDKDRSVGERKLREAVAKDGITWPQIFNVNGTDKDLTTIFSVYAYPTKILVDQSGNIILRVTDDEERKLDAKLAELLGT